MSAAGAGHGEKESRKRELAVGALLTKGTLAEAAAEVGIAESTLRRWLKKPRFQEAYRQARSQVVKHAVAQLQVGLSVATQALIAVAGDSDAPHAARVSAARSMFEFSLRAVELEDIEERLRRLEARAEEAADE